MNQVITGSPFGNETMVGVPQAAPGQKTALNRRAFIIALICALMAVTVLAGYMRRYEQEVSGGEQVQLLVALKPIPVGTIVTEEMLATRGVPRAYVEERAILAKDRDRVIGLRIGTMLQSQHVVMWTDFAVSTEERRSLSSLVQPGMRSFTISATSNGDKGYALIKSGDRIDVMAALPSPTVKDQTYSVLLLQNVLVLAVGTDVNDQGDKAPKDRAELLLSVSLTIPEAQILSLATDKGKLSVALRNPDDVRVAEGMKDLTSEALAEGQPRIQVQRARRTGAVRVEADR